MNITQHHFSGQNNLFSQIMIELVDSEQVKVAEFPKLALIHGILLSLLI